MSNARTVNGTPKKEFELCTWGGSDVDESFRLRATGSWMSDNDPVNVNRIDKRWAVPKDFDNPHDGTESATVGLSFKAFGAGISVSLSDAYGGKHLGGLGRHPEYAVGNWPTSLANNGVWGDWEDSCSWWNDWTRFCGSTDFQGTIVHGLFEYDQALDENALYWPVEMFHDIRCGKPIWDSGCDDIIHQG